jgi:hypothetical protein
MLIHQCPQELFMVVPRKNQGLAKYTCVIQINKIQDQPQDRGTWGIHRALASVLTLNA